MAHTSGLTYHFLEDTPVGRLYEETDFFDPMTSLKKGIDDLAELPLAFQPGSRWHYSVGIDVAARILEVVSGKPLGRVLSERLFEPLGMVDTAFEVPAPKRSRLAALYGRPDIGLPQTKAREALEAWERGVNERLDVTGTHPVDAPETEA